MADQTPTGTRRTEKDVQVQFPRAGEHGNAEKLTADALLEAGLGSATPPAPASLAAGSPSAPAPPRTTPPASAPPGGGGSALTADALMEAGLGSTRAPSSYSPPSGGGPLAGMGSTGATLEQKAATTMRAITGSAIEAAPVLPAAVAGAQTGAVIGAPFLPPFGSAVMGFTGFVAGGTAGYFAGRELRRQAANAFPGSVGGDPESLPLELRPFAYSGEVVGGSLSFGGTFYGLARAGVRAGSGTLVQRMVSRTLESARNNPLLFATAEVSGTTSAAVASGAAELNAPGRAEVRVPAEIAAGVFSPSRLLATTASSAMSIVRRALMGAANLAPEGMAERLFPGAASAQQEQARKILLDYLNETGTDVTALRRSLTKRDIADLPLSAGQKTGDPALLALETGLARTDEKFRKALADGGKDALSVLRDMVVMLRGTGDPALIKLAADIRDEAIKNALMMRLETARQNALAAVGRIANDTPEVREALSVQVFDALTAALTDVRAVERSLWEAIPGDLIVSDAPIRDAFSYLDGSRLAGDAYRLPAKITDFILHNLDELDEEALEAGIDSGGVAVEKVLKFRTAMLDASRDAASGAAPDRSAVRVYDIMADAALRALDDPSAAPELSDPLEAARAYSKGLNDVFTRSFVGAFLRKAHDGGYARSPESMLRFATASGQDATNLNMQDIDAAMDFVARRSEVVAARAGGEVPLRSAAEVEADMNTVMDAQERAMRIAATEAVDPTTGLPRKGRLEAFKTKYASTLKRFPQVTEAIDKALADSAELMRIAGRTKDAERVIKKRAVMYKLTGSENPADAIRTVINGYSPKAHLGQLIRSAKGAGRSARQRADRVEYDPAPPPPGPPPTAESFASGQFAPLQSWTGTARLRHARQMPAGGEPGDLRRFDAEAGEEHPRYGSVFGDSGLYLDSTGKFSTRDTDIRFSFDEVYNTEVKFDQALILTPQNIGTFKRDLLGLPAGASPADYSPRDLENAVREAGYDGVILQGFDEALDSLLTTPRSFDVPAEYRAGGTMKAWAPEDMPEVAAWRDAHVQKIVDERAARGATSPYEREAAIGGPVDELDVGDYLESLWLKDVTQDQVYALRPDTVRVLGLTGSDRAPRAVFSVNSTPPATSSPAEDALMASVFDYAIHKATSPSGDIDLARLRSALTTPLRPNQPSLLAMMRDGNLGDPAVYTQIDALLARVDEVTEAIDAGDVAASAFDDPSAAFDFILRTAGATLGSQVSKILHGGSGASLIAAHAGSQTMRNVFERLPQGRTRAFLAEALRNPELLAAMLERPVSQKDALRLTKTIHGYILQTALPGGEQVEQEAQGPTGALPRGGMFGTQRTTQ